MFFYLAVTKDVLFHNSSPVPLAVFTCSATTVGMSWTTNAVDCYEVPDTATLLDTGLFSEIYQFNRHWKCLENISNARAGSPREQQHVLLQI